MVIESQLSFQVADIESDGILYISLVLDAKIIPTGVSSGVGVDPEEKIVLVGCNFDSAIKVAVFEGAVEAEFVGLDGGVHSFEGSVEEGGAIVVVVSESLLTNSNATFMKLLLKMRLKGAG